MSEEISLKCKISEMKHYSLCYFSEKSVMQEKNMAKKLKMELRVRNRENINDELRWKGQWENLKTRAAE